LNGEPVDALASVVHRNEATQKARILARKLKDVIDRQLFEINIQVLMSGKPAASERLGALRKNVTAKCYGGDITRKMKLLEKQKEGKKRMRKIGRVELSHDAFLTLIKK
jgi:GTP-binding protein LepA